MRFFGRYALNEFPAALRVGVLRDALAGLGQRRPAVARFIGEVCARNRIKIPTLKLIEDGTPQAYCYGSYASNARLVTGERVCSYTALWGGAGGVLVMLLGLGLAIAGAIWAR